MIVGLKKSSLSSKIEYEILTNYKIWPTTHIAAKALSKHDSTIDFYDEKQIKSNQELKFLNRFNGVSENVRKESLNMYVRPMINKKKARGEL